MENARRRNDGITSGRICSFQAIVKVTYLLPALGLAMLAGCATAGKVAVAPAPAVAAAEAPLAAGPSVVHLSNGREGFVIREQAGMDGRLRSDFEQAGALMREGQYAKAIVLLEKVTAQAPGVSAPHINLAIAYRKVDKPEPAEQHLKKALELVPAHPVASNEYGLLLRTTGRFAESRKVYEQTLAAFPEYYPAHKNLGILCDLYLRDAACAMEHYRVYGQAVPADPRVKVWLADLQNRTGNRTAGLKEATEPENPMLLSKAKE